MRGKLVTDPAEQAALLGGRYLDDSSDLTPQASDYPTTMLPTVVKVARQYKRDKEPEVTDEETDNIEVSEFVVPPARVNLELGVTINLGNFESCRLSVGVEVPCYREELDNAYAYWLAYAKGKIVEEQNGIKQWALTRGSRNNTPF